MNFESNWTQSLFNIIDYETDCFLNKDSTEKINKRKLNLLAACFILNEDLELTKHLNQLFTKILTKWPYLV